MSRIISESGYRELSHIVQTEDGKLYLVDSNNTLDHGYETMVFRWSKRKKKPTSWKDLYCAFHLSEKSMRLAHYTICNSLEEYI